jgi:hypothetical protein
MRWTERRVYLLVADSVAAISAIAGGVAVMVGWIKFPAEWLAQSWLNWLVSDYFVAGAILFLVVGGSALAAAVATLVRREAAVGFSFAAGLVMMGWIVGEVAILGQFAWLQLAYFVVGAIMVLLAVAFARESRQVEVHAPGPPLFGRVTLPR